MCGIAGYLGCRDRRVLEAMAARIAHRGPDGQGFFVDETSGVGLAHRRLAIIDPTPAAAQPMASCNSRYHVVFNGEIYNFKTIAADLSAEGYRFNPNSDTAILGPLYDRYGVNGFARLNGIFAFALWDAKEQELIVVRDGLGVKPLYIAQTTAGLFFASELKALCAVESIGREIDNTALLDYLTYLWSPGERTLLAQVRKLLPGHYLRAKRGRCDVKRWYDPPIGGDAPSLSVADAKRSVRDAFNRAVADQCLSDVPIGAFLSGGVDSSAIVAAMVDSGNRPERTYCIGFDGPSMEDEGFSDDLRHARTVAAKLKVPLSEIRVCAPDPAKIEQIPVMLDEPEWDIAALYVAEIAAAARADGIKVLLSGTGGDDVFSGYRRHRAAALRSRFGPLTRWMPRTLPNDLPVNAALRRRWERLAYIFEGSDDAFLARAFEFNRRDRAIACLTPDLARRARPTPSGSLQRGIDTTRGRSLVDRMLYLELLGFLPDHNLNYTDKAGMFHGVEIRVPFLDTRLLELAAKIPWRLKTRGFAEKWILKEAFSDRLPPQVLRRKKTGFGGPVRIWLREGELGSWARDTIASRAFRERGIFDVAAVKRLLDDTIAGRSDGAHLVLAVLMIEAWCRRFYDHQARCCLPAPAYEDASNG